MKRLMKTTFYSILMTCILPNIYASNDTALFRLMKDHRVLAKKSVVHLNVELNEREVGEFKEFGIKIGHHYINKKRVFNVFTGKLISSELITFLDKKDIEVKVVELDEYHGMSIDALIAAPFNFFNPDDVYIDTSLMSLMDNDSTLSGGYGKDKIEINIDQAVEITGREMGLRMIDDIKGCLLDKGTYNLSKLNPENQEKCRNFKSEIYTLSISGYDENEIKEIIQDLEPMITPKNLEYTLSDIDWYKRNFDK